MQLRNKSTGFINSWSDDSERILQRMCRDGVAYTKNKRETQLIGIKLKIFIDNGFLDVLPREKKHDTAVVKNPASLWIPKFTNGKKIGWNVKKVNI